MDRPFPSFDEWLTWVFTRAYPWFSCGAWGESKEDEHFDGLDYVHPERVWAYLSRLLGAPEVVIERFDRDQIGSGFWYIASSSCSNYAHLLMKEQFDLAARLEALGNVSRVYERVFARVCEPQLGHLRRGPSDPPDNEANGVCYMWWDVFPMYPRTENPFSCNDPDVVKNRAEHEAIERVCLDVMERTLAIPHEACQEGALHGLGHWHSGYPTRTEGIIDAFLSRSPGISPELREYALCAREGGVQ